jgi:hypothetical protein
MKFENSLIKENSFFSNKTRNKLKKSTKRKVDFDIIIKKIIMSELTMIDQHSEKDFHNNSTKRKQNLDCSFY